MRKVKLWLNGYQIFCETQHLIIKGTGWIESTYLLKGTSQHHAQWKKAFLLRSVTIYSYNLLTILCEGYRLCNKVRNGNKQHLNHKGKTKALYL